MEVGVRNIAELKQFGNDLKYLSEQMAYAFLVTENKMHQVCEGWNDEVNLKFMNEFQRNVKEINKIADNMLDFSTFIAKSCEFLEMYRNIKF